MLSPGRTSEESLISALEDCRFFGGILTDTFASDYFLIFLELLIYKLDFPWLVCTILIMLSGRSVKQSPQSPDAVAPLPIGLLLRYSFIEFLFIYNYDVGQTLSREF